MSVIAYGQYGTIDRNDTSVQVVYDYYMYDHWRAYPATSAVYVPPCVYRIVTPDSIEYSPGTDYYDYLSYLTIPSTLVQQDGKYGIINKGDTIIIPLEYDSLIRLADYEPQMFIAKKGSFFGLINKKNQAEIPFEYDRIHLLSNGHYGGHYYSSLYVEKDGKVGLMRTNGSMELACKYDYIDVSCQQVDCPKSGVQYYVAIDGKYGYVNPDGSEAISLKYEELNAKGFSGLIRARNDGLVGLMDTLENFVVPQEYEQLYDEYMWRYPNLTAFKKNGKWGLMFGPYDSMTTILPPTYDSVFTDYTFKDHFIIINNGKWGLTDTNGKEVIAPKYEQIQAMDDGTFGYKLDGRWGFMNNKGFHHCSPRYDSIYDNDKNWCLVTRGDRYGICKTSGKQIAEPVYNAPIWDDYIHWEEIFYAGRIALSKGGWSDDDNCKMGVIDSNGRVLLPFVYECYDDLVYNYGSTLIARKNGKEVLINAQGKEVYLGDYDHIEKRRRGYEFYTLIKGDKVGLVSPQGKLITTAKYDDIDFDWISEEGSEEPSLHFRVRLGDKLGLLDSNGRVVLDVKYQGISLRSDLRVQVVSEDRVRLFNLKTRKFELFDTKHMRSFNNYVGAVYGVRDEAFFVDASGRKVNEEEYNHIWLKSDGKYFEVKRGNLYGICDSLGNLIVKPQFTKIKYWDGTFGAGKRGNHYCFFDAQGDTIVGYRYEKVKGVYGDFVCVRINDKFGVVRRNGETVIEPALTEKIDFTGFDNFDVRPINENYKYGVVNREMKRIIPTEFSFLTFVKVHGKTYILAKKNDLTAVYDSKGNTLSTHQFTKWEQDSVGELFLYNDYSWYQLTSTGEIEAVDR